MATVPDISRVLVIDDQPQSTGALWSVLSTQGYHVRTVAEEGPALTTFDAWRPGLVIADVSIEEMRGIELCRRIRSASSVPIIVLSAATEERRKVAALDSGADDYIVKPFVVGELLARVRAALRRAENVVTGPAAFEAGVFRIDFDSRRVFVRASEIRLTPKEFELFVFLARHPNRVIPHGTLLGQIWGARAADHREYLRVFMSQLRRKLEPNPSQPRYLVTEPWVGYRFNADGGALAGAAEDCRPAERAPASR